LQLAIDNQKSKIDSGGLYHREGKPYKRKARQSPGFGTYDFGFRIFKFAMGNPKFDPALEIVPTLPRTGKNNDDPVALFQVC
jgi:hypothetical protein